MPTTNCYHFAAEPKTQVTLPRRAPMRRSMEALRTLLLRHQTAAIAVVMIALCMKALVPAGIMVSAGTKFLTVEICADASGLDTTRHIAIPLKSPIKGDPLTKTAADSPCAFTALGMAALGGADAVVLALALAFILLIGFAPVRTALVRPAGHLRPPLRGPPVPA